MAVRNAVAVMAPGSVMSGHAHHDTAAVQATSQHCLSMAVFRCWARSRCQVRAAQHEKHDRSPPPPLPLLPQAHFRKRPR